MTTQLNKVERKAEQQRVSRLCERLELHIQTFIAVSNLDKTSLKDIEIPDIAGNLALAVAILESHNSN